MSTFRQDLKTPLVVWTVAGCALLRGSIYEEAPPYWVGVSFLLAAAFLLVYQYVSVFKARRGGER